MLQEMGKLCCWGLLQGVGHAPSWVLGCEESWLALKLLSWTCALWAGAVFLAWSGAQARWVLCSVW